MAEEQVVRTPDEAQVDDLYTRQAASFAAEADENVEGAIGRYGFTLWHALDPERATRFGERLRIQQLNANELHNRGTMAARKGDFAKAEADFRAALEKDPDHGLAAFNLAVCLEKRERFKEARQAYQQYLEILDRAPGRVDLRTAADGDLADEKARVQEHIDTLRKR